MQFAPIELNETTYTKMLGTLCNLELRESESCYTNSFRKII